MFREQKLDVGSLQNKKKYRGKRYRLEWIGLIKTPILLLNNNRRH